jgi:glutamine amidotransferase
VLELQCHPFAHGRYLFMHNGIIAGFPKIRRKLVGMLTDEAYDAVQSFHSDSAVSFALFLSLLPNMSDVLPADVLMRTVQSVYELIIRVQEEAGIFTDISRLNFVLTDGHSLIATRYVAPSTVNPASLYYAEGTTFRYTITILCPDCFLCCELLRAQVGLMMHELALAVVGVECTILPCNL